MYLDPADEANLIDYLGSKLPITRKHIAQVLEALPGAIVACNAKVLESPEEAEDIPVTGSEDDTVIDPEGDDEFDLDQAVLDFLNDATIEQMIEVKGIGQATAEDIEMYRPIEFMEDVKAEILSDSQYNNLTEYLLQS